MSEVTLDGLHCMPLTEVRCFWPRKQISLDQSGTRSPSRAVLAMVAPSIDELEKCRKAFTTWTGDSRLVWQ